MFDAATREKFRYPFKGQISTEDLWDLTPEQLNSVYMALNAEKKPASTATLIATRTRDDETLEAKIRIVRYIFETKQRETAERKEKAERAARKKHLTEILAHKEEAALADLPPEELRKMIDELGE